MTLKTSSNNINPSLNLFSYTFKKNGGLTLLMAIFMLLGCPGYVLMSIERYLKASKTSVFNLDKISSTVSIAITVITGLLAIMLCYINFHYLYSKKSSDVFHALPLKRSELLLSRFFASVIPVFIPVILSYASLFAMLTSKKIEGSIDIILFGLISNILVVFACSAFTMLFIICAGSTFDFIFSYFGNNLGLILVITVIMSMCEHYLKGFSYQNSQIAFMSVSPFVYAMCKTSELSRTKLFGLSQIIFFAVLILITVISLVLSNVLYNHRKSEKSGETFAYRFVYYICSIIVSFIGAYGCGIIFSNGEYNACYWVFTILGAILVAITFGAIMNRGFKTFRSSIVIGGCASILIAIATLIMIVGAFGFTSYIPKSDDIKTASVNFNGIRAEFDNPKLVTDLHTKIVDNIDDVGSGFEGENINWIKIDYTQKSGINTAREYYIDYADYGNELLSIYKSDERIKDTRELATKLSYTDISISDYGILKNGESSDGDFSGASISRSELNLIMDAYAKDLKKATVDSIKTDNVHNYSISGSDEEYNYYSIDLIVEDSFTDTMKIINSLNLHNRVDSAIKQ